MYVNLPGSYVQLQDGNLGISAVDNTQSVLVLGTATKGLTSEPYLMSDLGSVVKEFGADSEIARAASEVKKGGATNIYVYRLPGTAPELKHLGAEGEDDTSPPAGITIRTTQESPEGAEKYGVSYRHAKNIGTAGAAASSVSVVGELLVVNLETEEVVWLGSALEGASTDTGEVDVQFDLSDIAVKPTTGPESITLSGFGGGYQTTVDGTTSYNTCTIPISGVDVTYSFAAASVTEANNFVTAFNATDLDLAFTAEIVDTNKVKITANKNTNADGELVYGGSHPWAGYTARPFVSGTITTTKTGTTSLPAVAEGEHNLSLSLDVGLYPQDATRPFANAGGTVVIRLDKIVEGAVPTNTTIYSFTSGITKFEHAAIATRIEKNGLGTSRMTYSTGATGASISLMKRYEKLHTAFENLDLAAFDFVVPYGASVDAKNVADNDTVVLSGGAYPTPGQVNDGLPYLSLYENGDYTYTYYWSTAGEGLPQVSSDGQLPTGGTFSYTQVNFAHLVAMYCHENSTDYRSCYGVLGTTLPASVTSRGIREYFGKAPTYSLDRLSGGYQIVQESDNGAGLLGHKLIGGNSGFNDGAKRGGLFLTKDKTMNYTASNLEFDANGKRVDLGKYLSVVAIFGTTSDDINLRRPAYLCNAATIVAGMLPQLSPIDSLINMSVPGLNIPYRLETKTVDVGCGLGLTLAKSENNVAVIADSPTFASPTSDYTRLTTVRIVGKIAEELRTAARPFLGKGLSGPKRNALEAAIGEVLKLNLGETTSVQVITNARFKLTQSASDRVLGKVRVDLTITPVFELRQITFSVNLSV